MRGDTFLPSLQWMMAEVLSSFDHLQFVPSTFCEKGAWVCVKVSGPAVPSYPPPPPHPSSDSAATEEAPGGATPDLCSEAPV